MSKFVRKKGESDAQTSTPAVSKDTRSNKGRNARKSRAGGSNHCDTGRDRINNYGILDGTHNDPAWYHLNDAANKAAGALPFGYVLGSHRDNRYFAGSPQIPAIKDPTPGLAIIWYTPIPGMSKDANSALNVAAQGAYAWIRHANSGHTNYDPSDLMLYYLAIDNAQTLYAWMCKIYGNLSKYSAVNRYFPEDWFRTVNIDFADFQNNIPGFLAYLNMFALKLATFAVPAEFPIFKRHALLASSMFTDSGLSQSKFQVYDFEPRHIFKYTGLDTESNVTCLSPVKMPNVGGAPLTFAKLTEFADSIINPLIANVDDFGTMSGDVRKAYMNGGLFSVNMISSDYTTNFLYDELMLQQIHNMDLWGELVTDATASSNKVITSSSNYRIEASAITDTIVYQPMSLLALPLELKPGEVALRPIEVRGAKTVLVDKDAPTPDDVFEVTRDVSFVTFVGASNTPGVCVCRYDAVGTEIFENIAFVKAPGTGTTFMYTTLMSLQSAQDTMQLTAMFPHIENMMAAHAFRYDPEARLFFGYKVDGSSQYWISPDNRSLQNWTVMQRDNFEVINDVAMMALWNVPRLGKSF